MNLGQAIEILEEWIKIDRDMRDNSTESDYDRFCEKRNIALEMVLKEVQKSRAHK